MDAFLQRRMSDSRYRLNVSANRGPRTAVTEWYRTDDFAPSSASTSVVLSEQSCSRHEAAAKRKDSDAPFSKEKVKELENRDTSDGSDAGACWSKSTQPPKLYSVHIHSFVRMWFELQVTTSAFPAQLREQRGLAGLRRRPRRTTPPRRPSLRIDFPN
jgi:hypothetical protein